MEWYGDKNIQVKSDFAQAEWHAMSLILSFELT